MPDNQERRPTERPERRPAEEQRGATRMSQPAQDAEMLEAVGGSRLQPNPGQGQTGTPVNRAFEHSEGEQRSETLMGGQWADTLMEGRPEATPPAPPQSSSDESGKDNS